MPVIEVVMEKLMKYLMSSQSLPLYTTLHGQSMFAVKAKIYDVLYNPASSIDFNETSSYWSAPKSSKFLGFSLVTTW